MKKTGLADSPFFQHSPPLTVGSAQQVIHPPETERKTVRKSERVNTRSPERPNEKPNDRTDNRSEKRTPDVPTKRLTKRYSFEFYEDQVTQLKQLKYRAELRGESTTLSAIVRHALDLYLQAQEM